MTTTITTTTAMAVPAIHQTTIAVTLVMTLLPVAAQVMETTFSILQK